MIIPVIGVETLAEYEKQKDNLDQLTRPRQCPKCACERTFWKHGTYLRKVFDGEKDNDVRISRYICSNCTLVVSCLFSFIIPYVRTSPDLVAEAVEQYSEIETSYGRLASELTDLNSESSPKPSQTQVFRWVAFAAERADALCQAFQREFVMRGRTSVLADFPLATCPNAEKAKSNKKKSRLEKLRELLELARFWTQKTTKALQFTHAFFFSSVETLQAIFCRRKIKLPTPHNVKHVLF